MKIAILGGTFNPIHIGHLMLAEDVRKEFGYDKILFIPACVPPHKVYQACVSDADSAQERFVDQMIRRKYSNYYSKVQK